jgi:pyruvyltransferase
MIKIYQCGGHNVGDSITKPLIEHFCQDDVLNCKKEDTGKLLGVGSILSWGVRDGDIIWGSGLISDKILKLPSCKVLALRGKLTAKNVNSSCEVFGDPALLLPLIYNPINIKKEYDVGVVEHYVDKGLYIGEGYRISILQNWKSFVDEILKCKHIISSSLHGCIIPEAYGIPVTWVQLSDKVIGKGFKFRDYLTGTNRVSFSETFDLNLIQKSLLNVLNNEFNTKN